MLDIRVNNGPGLVTGVCYPYLSAYNMMGNEFYPHLSRQMMIDNIPLAIDEILSIKGQITDSRPNSPPNSLRPFASVNAALTEVPFGRRGACKENYVAHWGVNGSLVAAPPSLELIRNPGGSVSIGPWPSLNLSAYEYTRSDDTRIACTGGKLLNRAGTTQYGPYLGTWYNNQFGVDSFPATSRVRMETPFGESSGTRDCSYFMPGSSTPMGLAYTSTYDNCAWTSVNCSGYRYVYDVTVTRLSWSIYSYGLLEFNWRISITRTRYAMVGKGTAAHLEYDSVSSLSKDVTSRGLVLTDVSGYDGTGLAQLVERRVTKVWQELSLKAPGRSSTAFGQALDSAVPTLASNNIENAVQLTDAIRSSPAMFAAFKEVYQGLKLIPRKAMLATLGRLIKSGPIKSVGLAVSVCSKVYLIWRYVLKPTYKDIHELKSKLIPILDRTRVSGTGHGMSTTVVRILGVDVTFEMREKVRVSSDSSVPMERLRRLGLSPTPSQLWDLIPLSFVVDWAIGVQGFLKGLEYNFLPGVILGLGCSSVKSDRIDLMELEGIELPAMLSGSAEVWFYQRIPQVTAPTCVPELSGRPACQWWQAAAALVGSQIGVKPSVSLSRIPRLW